MLNAERSFCLMMMAGFAQSLGQVPMATLLLRNSVPHMRGRVMGIRMLAINGNMPGLLISGPLIAGYGYSAAAALYCATLRWTSGGAKAGFCSSVP